MDSETRTYIRDELGRFAKESAAGSSGPESTAQFDELKRSNDKLKSDVKALSSALAKLERKFNRRIGETEDTALIPWDWINVVGVVVCIVSLYTVDAITSIKLPNLNPFQQATQETPGAGTPIAPGAETTATGSAQGATVVNKAKDWVGKDFKPGQTARCADFVRSVFSSLGIQVGVTQSPIDGESPNPETANSFFGNDLGTIKRDKSQLQPGDLVAFGGTYGGYPASTITHVGIYVGNGQMVDRPTSSEPVKLRSIDTFQHFVAGITLKNLQSPTAPSLPVAGDLKLTPAVSNSPAPQPSNANGRSNNLI